MKQRDKIIRKLINIYASYRHSEITKSSKYANLCKKHIEKGWFNQRREIISDTKKEIELFELEKPNVQVSESLYLLDEKNRNTLEYDLSYALIMKSLAPNWSRKQKKYFKKATTLLNNCENDYFLSFTSRKSNPAELNITHLNYAHFIQYILMLKDWDEELINAEKNNINLLARTINMLLSQELNGFYYPSHEGDNTIVEEKLEKNCCSSFAFVQLIQNVIFRLNADKCNYCHLEYQYATKAIHPDLRLYILAERSHERLITKRNVEKEYKDWHAEVEKKNKIHLPFTENFNIEQIKKMRCEIEEKLSERISNYKDNLFNTIPA